MDSRWRFLHRLENEAMTQKDSMSRVMVNSVSKARASGSEVRQTHSLSQRGSEIKVAKQVISHWREKLLARSEVPVPQTDTGRQGENPKTNGRTLVKELGKMTP